MNAAHPALVALADALAPLLAERLKTTETSALVTDVDGAALAGVSARTLREAAKRGEIAGSKKGRRFIFLRDEVIAWARGRSTTKPRETSRRPEGAVDALARELGLTVVNGGAR